MGREGKAKAIWKKYAGKEHPRRKWTTVDAADYNRALENYHAVVEAVVENGLTWRQAATHFKLSVRVVEKIARRWRKQEEALGRKRKFLEEGDWADGITSRFKERLLEVAEAEGGISTEKYNQMKIGQSHFKGTGIYRVGDAPLVAPAGKNTTIYQNVLILQGMSPEDQEKLSELRRRELVAGADSGTGTLSRLGMGAPEDQDLAALVVEKLHSDV